MENIRIGNSVHVSWRLYNNNGSQYALSGKIRRLWIISAALEKEITSYGIQGRNEIVFSVPADDLIRYGTYKIRLTIRESESETEDATYDLTQIFQVVSQSYPNASNAIGGVADLSFTSVLNNVVIERIEGLSAYEIAVNNGYEGTEQEWIAMYDNAVTAANNAAEEAIAATETVMANEESRQLAESARDTAEQARMVAEQSRVSAERARAQAEQARQAAEQGRASSEQSRTIAETARETRAASDHATAQSDHATAANDHSVATSDHAAAATDHTIASSDHSIAVTDHEASTSATEDANDAADAANDAAASVQHIVETRIGSETIHNIVELTQAEYDALQTKRDDTMYIITDTEIPSSEVGIAGFEQTTVSTEDGGTNIWTVTLTNGQTFQLAVKNGTKGPQGNTGSSVDYPYELVNNLTTDDATKGLSAAMGKALEDEIAAMIQPNALVDFSISDEANMAIVQFADGHVRTKFFDSADIAIVGKIVSRYKGKKLSILGDSISTFGDPSATNENGTYCYSYYPSASCRYSVDGVDSIAFDVADTYWMRLINATGMELGINESYRGSRVSGTDSTAFNNQTRINHLGENGTPDVILVFGGTNDAGGGVTVGTFDTTNPQGYTDGEIAALPVTTFADAYRTMLIRLMKTYPLAEIVVILPTFTSSYYTITNLDLYVEVIKEACDFFGIKYIDARCTGINVYNRGTYLSDGLHPNTEGMRLLYEKILRQLLFV